LPKIETLNSADQTILNAYLRDICVARICRSKLKVAALSVMLTKKKNKRQKSGEQETAPIPS
jgi:hypothetical protein